MVDFERLGIWLKCRWETMIISWKGMLTSMVGHLMTSGTDSPDVPFWSEQLLELID